MKRIFMNVVVSGIFCLTMYPALLSGQSCDNMVSYWRMEENAGNTFSDMVGGHDAIAVVSGPTNVNGKVGKAQSFDGVSNYLTVSDHPDFDWAGDASFTIELWVKLNAISSADNMIFIGRDESPGNIHWWIGAEKNTGKAMFVLRNSLNTEQISFGPNMTIGTWYHVVAVRDASTGSNYFYVNNSLVDTDVVDYSSGSFGTDATIEFGALNYNGSTDRFFANAVIDELAIYNVPLTSGDIASHYDKGNLGIGYCEDYSPSFLSIPDTLATVGETFNYEAYATGLPPIAYSLTEGPGSINASTGVVTWTPNDVNQSGTRFTVTATNAQGSVSQSFIVYVSEEPTCPNGIQNFYKLNETAGGPYADFAGGNDAEALNPPTPVAGKFNGAQQFDGVNDGLNLPDNGTYNFPKNSSFSIEFWLKTPGSTSSNMVVAGRQGTFGDSDTSDLHLWVGVMKNTGAVSFYLRDAKGNEPSPSGMITGGDVDDNTWHYVVAVRDGSSNRSFIYVDGTEVASSEAYTYGNTFGTFEGDPFNIGFLSRQNGNPDYFYNGILDEVAIYTKALSASEISTNYVQSFGGSWHCEPGNYAPAFTSDPILDAVEDQLYTYEIQTNDIDPDDVLSLTMNEKPEWLTFTNLGNGSGTLSGTPSDSDIGPHNVSLTVSDTKTPVEQAFVITVANQDDPPQITSTPPVSVDEDELYSYTIEATDPDLGDVLTYSAPTIPAWLTFDPNTQVLSGTPGNDEVGDHEVTLEVTDGNTSVQQPFTITVNNVNDPPVVSGQVALSFEEDTEFTLSLSDFTWEDVDNTVDELSLVVEPGTNYTFSGTSVTPADNFNGNLIVNIRVADPESSSNSFGAEVTIMPVNDAPVITSDVSSPSVKTAIVDKLYGFVLTASDPDDDDIIMAPVSLPSFLTFDTNTGILGGTPSVDDLGDHIVALSVTDGMEVVTVNYTLTVRFPVGIDQDDKLIHRVYPNPASDQVTFELDLADQSVLKVFDMTGKVWIERQLSPGDDRVTLDVSAMDEGLYTYKIVSGDRMTVRSFIISR